MHPNPTSRLQPTSRRTLLLAGLVTTALAACSSPSLATGNSVGVDVIDRDSGQVLEVYHHRGRRYVAGRPGARYAIRITNRSGGRVLAVTAVDGVNIVSGQTASWGQTGYVFAPWQSYELTGWRKSDAQVASFEFTSLPDSYAARTSRPLDVGVIGVAVFRERSRPVVQAPLQSPLQAPAERYERRAERKGDIAESNAPGSAPAPSTLARGATGEASAGAAPDITAKSQDAARSRLGTGHGEREYSQVSRTEFERASTAPDEIVSIQYDRYENLVAAGIIPGDSFGFRPRPFPGSRDSAAYVPDPPRN